MKPKAFWWQIVIAGMDKSKKGEPVLGEFMQRLFDSRPRFRLKHHVFAISLVFGITLSGMYIMRDNVEETMPWKARSKLQ